jgi:hypothetical protein
MLDASGLRYGNECLGQPAPAVGLTNPARPPPYPWSSMRRPSPSHQSVVDLAVR